MKALIPVLIVATSSLAVASVQYARSAAAERERADAELAVRLERDARIAELERNQLQLERALKLAQSAPPPQPVVAPSAPKSTAPPPVAAGGAASDTVSGRFSSAPMARSFPGPNASPAHQKFMRTRVKAGLRQMYRDLGPSLGLTAEQTAQFIDLLADQQTRQVGKELPQDPASMQQYASDTMRRNNEEIANLIGHDKLTAWQDFQKSLGERMQLNQLREQLDAAGVPMQQEQSERLLNAMVEERDRNPRPAFEPGSQPQEVMARHNQWQEDYERAVNEHAKSILSAEQYASYREYQDWQAEMRNSAVMSSNGGAISNAVVAAPVTLPAFGPGPGAVRMVAPMMISPAPPPIPQQ